MIKIGITGHRPHRLKVSEEKLGQRVAGVLHGMIAASGAASPEPVLDIISPLAEGTDRIVAREALALGQNLTAILPFERRDYEATFSDRTTTKEFRKLWKAANERLTLDGLAKHTEASYVAVGMLTLARADLVLTIWDGEPAQGRGGTPEILRDALEWGLPVIWIHASEDREPVLLSAGNEGTPLSLDQAAATARPVTQDTYQALVTQFRNNP